MVSCVGPLVTVAAAVGVMLISEAVNAPSPEVANSSEKSNVTPNAALTLTPEFRETFTVGAVVSGGGGDESPASDTLVVTDSAFPVVAIGFMAKSVTLSEGSVTVMSPFALAAGVIFTR